MRGGWPPIAVCDNCLNMAISSVEGSYLCRGTGAGALSGAREFVLGRGGGGPLGGGLAGGNG